MADAHLSQKMGNMDKLSVELSALCVATVDDQRAEPGHVASVFAENAIKMGPVNEVKMGESMCYMDFLAMEQFQRLIMAETNTVIREM